MKRVRFMLATEASDHAHAVLIGFASMDAAFVRLLPRWAGWLPSITPANSQEAGAGPA